MIEFESFTLANGLQVIVHEDHSIQTAVLNLLYDVGSKDEDPKLTGFAHLFEHLMFGGSKNVENFDEPLQQAGGENNAFTSPDVTNYYLTLPAQNIETGFWLESDRMLSLSFDPKVLEVQRGVVIEEFKQRYLNQPYGDIWLKLRPLAYHEHSYNWPTIGKEISHIEKVTMKDVKAFSKKHYAPDNAILVVAGNVTLDQIKKLSEKWFGEIPPSNRPKRRLPTEPAQYTKRTVTVEANVPLDQLTMAFHMPGKFDKGYYAADLLSDVLGRDKSSRLYARLVKDEQIFNSLNAYVTGSIDPGLLVITGKLNRGKDIYAAEKKVWEVIDEVRSEVDQAELEKVKNQAESNLVFGEIEVLNRALRLAMASLSGDTSLVNQEAEMINGVTLEEVRSAADDILKEENCSVLYYLSKQP